MRFILSMAAAGLMSVSANAQLVGGQVGGALGGAGHVGSTASGAARVDPSLSDTFRAGDAARETADRTANTADRASQPRTVSVAAGASVRVDRGTRCHYQPDDYYYDPAYRDGYYYCERSGTAVSGGTQVRAGSPRR